ncbi:hypothetical protein EDF56_101410 [Novosphingobium sp. PhB165]|nr:hypothetical protein EDF56_101410 [Novosphingobium sp. PhB165]
MRISLIFLASFVLLVPSAQAAPQQLGAIWQRGNDAIVVAPCPSDGDSDDYCRAVEVTQGAQATPLGAGYMDVKLLWASRSPDTTPSVVVLGDSGGSGGEGDLFVVGFDQRLTIRKLSGERMDSVVVRTDRDSPRFALPFDIEYFNGAPHAAPAIVMLPVRWAEDEQGGDFALDPAVMTDPPPSRRELASRLTAIQGELRGWAQDKDPAYPLYPRQESALGTPVTVQTLANLALSGHSDLARELLHLAWPENRAKNGNPSNGEEAFWADLCGSIANHPLWKRLALEHLPHADLILAGAAEARPLPAK